MSKRKRRLRLLGEIRKGKAQKKKNRSENLRYEGTSGVRPRVITKTVDVGLMIAQLTRLRAFHFFLRSHLSIRDKTNLDPETLIIWCVFFRSTVLHLLICNQACDLNPAAENIAGRGIRPWKSSPSGRKVTNDRSLRSKFIANFGSGVYFSPKRVLLGFLNSKSALSSRKLAPPRE